MDAIDYGEFVIKAPMYFIMDRTKKMPDLQNVLLARTASTEYGLIFTDTAGVQEFYEALGKPGWAVIGEIASKEDFLAMLVTLKESGICKELGFDVRYLKPAKHLISVDVLINRIHQEMGK